MKLLKILISVILLASALTFVSYAGSDNIGFTYYTDSETGTVCISGILTDSTPDTVKIPQSIGDIKVTKIQNAVKVNDYGDVKYQPFDLMGAKHLVIPEGVERIGDCFIGTENLETVRLPKSLKVLPSYCFAQAKKLYSINLEYVESVSSFAFEGCSSLREVNLLYAKKVGTNAFGLTENLTIYAMKNSAAQTYAEKNGINFTAASGFEKKALALYGLGLMKGTKTSPYGRIDFDLDRTPTRAEAITMLVRFIGKEKEAAGNTGGHPFTDVPQWADIYVSYAYQNGLTKGISDTLFGADEYATPEMYLTFMLRALGYSDSGDNADFSYEDPWMFACEKGITPRQMNTSPFYRSEMVDMSYLALFASLRGTDTPLYEKMISDGVFTKEDFEYWKL